MSATPGPASMRAVERVCDLLDALRERPAGISLDRAARISGLPRSSAYRYLLALERRGYVSRDRARGTFCASPRRAARRLRDRVGGTADRLADLLRPLRHPGAVSLAVVGYDARRAVLRRLDRPPDPRDELVAPFRDRPARERAAGIAALAPGVAGVAGPTPPGASGVRSTGPPLGRIAVILDVRSGLAEIGVAVPEAGQPVALAVIARQERLGDELMQALRTAANHCGEVLSAGC